MAVPLSPPSRAVFGGLVACFRLYVRLGAVCVALFPVSRAWLTLGGAVSMAVVGVGVGVVVGVTVGPVVPAVGLMLVVVALLVSSLFSPPSWAVSGGLGVRVRVYARVGPAGLVRAPVRVL